MFESTNKSHKVTNSELWIILKRDYKGQKYKNTVVCSLTSFTLEIIVGKNKTRLQKIVANWCSLYKFLIINYTPMVKYSNISQY